MQDWREWSENTGFMKTIAIVVAAGRGSRANLPGGEVFPKQYRLIAGEPLLRHTLRAFCKHPMIDRVICITHPDDMSLYRRASEGLERLMSPVSGGVTRQKSVLAGLEALAGENPDLVLIHDGARPFATQALISRVIETACSDGGALPAIAVSDTLRRGENEIAGELVKRAGLFASQTPQGFDFKKILASHRRAAQESATQFTDDGEIARWAGMTVKLVEGESGNLKITRPEDFDMAELRLGATQMNRTAQVRTGLGFDVHAFGPGKEIVLCGVKIPHTAGLKGHSDADVGLHALTDALLGAISAGDIGAHFPPSDAQWKGVDSSRFLAHAAKLIAQAKGEIVHVDVTLICQAPKIGPHREAMRKRIAEILELESEQVSVKATTTEKLGFTGRGEGIAAQAVATINLACSASR